MYKEVKTINAVIHGGIIQRTTDNAFIPFDPDNTDAKEFAKWLSEGGVPEAAVEGENVSAEWITETIAKLF
jgi:hypothetical protein